MIPLSLPFGRLLIDLGTSLNLPAVAVPSLPGNIAQPLPVLPNHGLTGATIYLQGVNLVDVDPFNTPRRSSLE